MQNDLAITAVRQEQSERSKEKRYLWLFSLPIFVTVTFTALTGIGFPYSILALFLASVFSQYKLRWMFFAISIFALTYFLYAIIVSTAFHSIELPLRRLALLVDLLVLSLLVFNFRQARIHRAGHILFAAIALSLTLILGLRASQNFIGLILIVSFFGLLQRPSLILTLAHVGIAILFSSYTSAVAILIGYLFLVSYRLGLIAVGIGLVLAAIIAYLIGSGSHITSPSCQSSQHSTFASRCGTIL